MTEVSTEVKEAELNLKITKIQNIFDAISNNSALTTSQEIVAFVGPTKAGKSTLINCLMGNPLKCVQDLETEDISIVSEKPGPGPIIGSIGESETAIPKGFSTIPGTNWTMWDFPGFGDNKGTDQEIANAAAYEKVLRHQETVRFVLVVPIDLIKNDNPMQFFKLLNDINSICPNYASSLSLIATKSTRGNVAPRLNKLRTTEFPNADNETKKIVMNSKKIIDQLLKNNRCADFRTPEMDYGVKEQPFQSTDLPSILNVIKTTQGTNVSQFPLVISELAKYDILLLYTSFYRKVKEGVEKTCLSFVEFVQNRINEVQHNRGTSAEMKLALFKETSKKVVFVKNHSKDVQSFLRIIKGFGFQIDYLADILKKYVFIEKIRNMYKTGATQDGQGEQEFFKRIMITVNQSAQLYSDMIRNSEAASVEERRFESELQERQIEERRVLEADLRRLESENESILVKGAKFISKAVLTPINNIIVNPVLNTVEAVYLVGVKPMVHGCTHQ